MPLIDSHGRRINYLRLSVTDRCNLRCSYCMPAEGVPKRQHRDILRFEQLHDIAAAATELGIEKIRITGGEPLVRKGLIGFLERLSGLPGMEELVLTTNGVLLPQMAASLRDAGVQRLNISLDSLRPETFRHITRQGSLADVLAGIDAAERAGLPIKINCVVMNGINDDEVMDFAALTLDRSFDVRFIEYMPVIKEDGWQSLIVPGHRLLERISEHYSFDSVAMDERSGPAKNFRIKGAKGTLGLITPLSGHFCGDCNRIRVTASGRLKNCLFAEEVSDLRPFLRDGDDAVLKEALCRLILGKPRRHGLSAAKADHAAFAMASIGG